MRKLDLALHRPERHGTSERESQIEATWASRARFRSGNCKALVLKHVQLTICSRPGRYLHVGVPTGGRLPHLRLASAHKQPQTGYQLTGEPFRSTRRRAACLHRRSNLYRDLTSTQMGQSGGSLDEFTSKSATGTHRCYWSSPSPSLIIQSKRSREFNVHTNFGKSLTHETPPISGRFRACERSVSFQCLACRHIEAFKRCR